MNKFAPILAALALSAAGVTDAAAQSLLGARLRAPPPSSVTITQVGDNNGVGVGQSGVANSAGVAQYGDNNTGVVRQNGDDNRLRLVQGGDGNSANLTQNGDHNSLCLVQAGSNHNATMVQNGGETGRYVQRLDGRIVRLHGYGLLRRQC